MSELPGLAAARIWAAARFPYLASGIFGAQVTAVPGLDSVAIDERWQLAADPELVAGWSAAQFGSVLVHHVCHILRHHSERALATAVTKDDSRQWLSAADAEINDDLIPAGLELPGNPVLPRHFGADDGRLAEEYFALLKRREAGPEDEGPAAWLDCGSGADGLPRASDRPGGLDPWLADLLRRQVAEEVVRHAKQAGTVPAGLLRWARDVLAPRVDWRRLLAAELRRAIADVAGAADYSYRRP
ncbi:MAG TPA: hypothetical protein VK719_02425, partial [Trebonia sp.]|nr:hypothetical protein [Trebonia sp.]